MTPAVTLSQAGNYLMYPIGGKPLNVTFSVGNHVINGSIEYVFLDLQELSPNDTVVQQISLQNGFSSFIAHGWPWGILIHFSSCSYMVSGFLFQPQYLRCSRRNCKLQLLKYTTQ